MILKYFRLKRIVFWLKGYSSCLLMIVNWTTPKFECTIPYSIVTWWYQDNNTADIVTCTCTIATNICYRYSYVIVVASAAHIIEPDMSFSSQIPTEVREADFLRRVEEQLVQCSHYFDLDNYRKACLEKDISKTGKLSKEQVCLAALKAFKHLISFWEMYDSYSCHMISSCERREKLIAIYLHLPSKASFKVG